MKLLMVSRYRDIVFSLVVCMLVIYAVDLHFLHFLIFIERYFNQECSLLINGINGIEQFALTLKGVKLLQVHF